MGLFPLYLIVCFLVALTGREKRFGYWGIFAFSLFLSPLIGLIIGLASSKVKKDSAAELRNLAIKYRKMGQTEKSIKVLHQALKYSPQNVKVLFDLSCCYSVINETEDSFRFLIKAIENGYSDTEKIESDKDLSNLRDTNKFKLLKNNGYDIKNLQNISKNSYSNNLDDLKKLKELLDMGAITFEEFEGKKRNILEK